jgi:hypothetical protein
VSAKIPLCSQDQEVNDFFGVLPEQDVTIACYLFMTSVNDSFGVLPEQDVTIACYLFMTSVGRILA